MSKSDLMQRLRGPAEKPVIRDGVRCFFCGRKGRPGCMVPVRVTLRLAGRPQTVSLHPGECVVRFLQVYGGEEQDE